MPDMAIKVKWEAKRPLTTDPPPPKVPRAITASTTTHGHRLVTVRDDGYRYDIRGYGNPYWMHVPTSRRWERDETPPEGLSVDDRDVALIVDACNESAWYAWKRDGRDPAANKGTYPLNAALTWIE